MENNSFSEIKKVYSGLGFGMIILVIIAISLLPGGIKNGFLDFLGSLPWKLIIWGIIIFFLYKVFATRKSK